MANWHETIRTKLDKYTGFDAEVGETHIIIACQNAESFDVSFHAEGDNFLVGFDGWHEHFDAEDDALNCFAFGLSKECRLKVVKRGQMECSWTVQSQESEVWVDDTTTGLIFIPFWRSAQVEYRQNTIMKKPND